MCNSRTCNSQTCALLQAVHTHDALLLTCVIVNTTAAIVVPWLVISWTMVSGLAGVLGVLSLQALEILHVGQLWVKLPSTSACLTPDYPPLVLPSCPG